MVAKLRIGNKIREKKYWGMRKRGSADYAGGLESWKHVWEKYKRWREGTDVSCLAYKKILGVEKKGEG